MRTLSDLSNQWQQFSIGGFYLTFSCSPAADRKGLMILQQSRAQLEEQQTHFVLRHSSEGSDCCLRFTLYLRSQVYWLHRSHTQCSHLHCSVNLCKILDTSRSGYDKHGALRSSSYISWGKKTHKSCYFCSSKQRQLPLGCERTQRGTRPTSDETNGLKLEHIFGECGWEGLDRHTTPHSIM